MDEATVSLLDAGDREEESKLRRQGWWAAKAFSPAMRLPGPGLPPAADAGSSYMFACHAEKHPSDAHAFKLLLGRNLQQPEKRHPEVWYWHTDMPPFVFQSSGGKDCGAGAFSLGGLAADAARLHVRALVVVHFFSGYRRSGDLHSIIDHQTARDGTHVFALSIDLCMQRKTGNLARPEALSWWKGKIRSGQIVAAGGGPPCETFTIARSASGGPRPVRSGDEPRGLPGNIQREWHQVSIGDKLLRFLLEILVVLAMQGLAGFMEHPQFPVWQRNNEAASVWTLEVVRYLRTLQCVTILSFDQCVCGADAKKPTTLLLLRLHGVRERILRQGDGGRCPHSPGSHEALIGRQNDGTFHTARAKVYPEGLNRVLGEELYSFATALGAEATDECMPAVFAQMLSQQCFDEETIQPDFHG